MILCFIVTCYLVLKIKNRQGAVSGCFVIAGTYMADLECVILQNNLRFQVLLGSKDYRLI